MSCDFVPDECFALAMQQCLIARACLVLGFDLPGLTENLDGVTGLLTEADVQLAIKHQCLGEALARAFEIAGFDMPPEPPRPEPPDFSGCTAAVQAITLAATDPLNRFGSVMTITLDANLKPTRITVP